MSLAATQRAAMLTELVAAGPDGVPESRLIDIGGLYWRERLKELCAQGHPIGWAMVEGEKTYFSEPVVERTASTDSSLPGQPVRSHGGEGDPSRSEDEAGLIPRASTDGSLSNRQDTLFPDKPLSHFESDREAA